MDGFVQEVWVGGEVVVVVAGEVGDGLAVLQLGLGSGRAGDYRASLVLELLEFRLGIGQRLGRPVFDEVVDFIFGQRHVFGFVGAVGGRE